MTIEEDISVILTCSVVNSFRGKTLGEDRINYARIKNVPRDMKLRLNRLFNNIFHSYIPQAYKRSLVSPILKPNSKNNLLCSYRPISLNSCISKIMDKIVANRLWWFINRNKLPSTLGKMWS